MLQSKHRWQWCIDWWISSHGHCETMAAALESLKGREECQMSVTEGAMAEWSMCDKVCWSPGRIGEKQEWSVNCESSSTMLLWGSSWSLITSHCTPFSCALWGHMYIYAPKTRPSILNKTTPRRFQMQLAECQHHTREHSEKPTQVKGRDVYLDAAGPVGGLTPRRLCRCSAK
jgi:hypothetical protein